MGLESGAMNNLFAALIILALIAVTATLAMGFYALFRGGTFGRAWSNKLMRLRVALQFVAIILIVAAVTWRQFVH
jgi:hypothetical protein